MKERLHKDSRQIALVAIVNFCKCVGSDCVKVVFVFYLPVEYIRKLCMYSTPHFVIAAKCSSMVIHNLYEIISPLDSFMVICGSLVSPELGICKRESLQVRLEALWLFSLGFPCPWVAACSIWRLRFF